MEEEYGRTLQKLARNTAETYAMHEGKAGFVYLSLLYGAAAVSLTGLKHLCDCLETKFATP